MIRQDVVWVQKYSSTATGSIGQKKYTPVGPRLKVPCNVYPLATDVSIALGLQELDTRLVVCDARPGDLHSVVIFEDADWEPAGPAKTFNKTHAARSVQVVIKKGG